MRSPFQRTERDPMWRREMRERWRRPITLFFLTLYIAGLSWFAYSLYASLVPVGSVELGVQARGIGHLLFISLLRLQILIWIPVAFLLGAPTIAAERERRALTEYLLAGLLPRQIVRAKFASIATFIMVMCAIPVPMLALCFPLGGVEPLELVIGFLLAIAVATVCAALGLLISVGKQRVTSAMQNGLICALLFLGIGWLIVPGLLEMSFWVWLACACLLAWGTNGIIGGCEDTLRAISVNLEIEEPGTLYCAFSFSALPAPLPDERLRKLLTLSPETVTEDVDDTPVWDVWIEKVAAYSAVAQREVRVGMRAARRRTEFAPPAFPYRYSLWAWALLGLCGAALFALVPVFAWLLYVGLALTTFAAVVVATLGSSAAFTREREQRMFAQLRVCALSPVEVVAGKIGAMLLLVAKDWGYPLLALFIAGLSQGVLLAIESALFVILTLLFAAALATLLSLVCHRTAIAASSALAILFFVFVLLPVGPGPLAYFVPELRVLFSSFPLKPMWIEPLSLLSWSSVGFPVSSLSPVAALFRLIGSLVVSDSFLILAATYLWSRTSLGDGETKTGFWRRGLVRSWR